MIAPFDLRQRSFHTINDSILNIPHRWRKRLIQFDDVRFPFHQICADFVSESSTSLQVSVSLVADDERMLTVARY